MLAHLHHLHFCGAPAPCYPRAMVWELWDTESNNLVDWFDTAPELQAALRKVTDLKGLQVAVRDRLGNVSWIDPTQAYYWTEAWQAGEREADEDLAAGRTRRFASADEAVRWLESDDDEPLLS